MKLKKFQGTYTALVTPFDEDSLVDYKSLKLIIEKQIESGISGLVILGSTGEAATLNEAEKNKIMLSAQEYVNGRVPLIVGTGSNSTSATIAMTKLAEKNNFDGVLLVCPYYNKPTQEGIFQHYKAISEAVDIPQIIYNVPGRSSININADTQLKIANECENIVATKEASGDLEQMMKIIKYSPSGFNVLCGDDALAPLCILAGGKGVISVISNYAPKLFTQCIELALTGNYKESLEMHYELFDFMQINFIESNPIPVKAIMSEMKLIKNNLRLPLVPITANNLLKIQSLLSTKALY